MELDYLNRVATLGIMIGEKDYWDKGYGTDSIMTMLKFAFDTMGLHRIELRTYEVNKRAITCYRKCGFKDEGRRRKRSFYRNQYIDEVWMRMLREEWDKLLSSEIPKRTTVAEKKRKISRRKT